MGTSNSKPEEDKALQLCRERKRFVKQALDGRCSLAATHDMYIQSLKSTGTALRKFVESSAAPDVDSSLYTSSSAATPPPPPPLSSSSTLFHASHMKLGATFSDKILKKPPSPFTTTLTSLTTPRNNNNTTPRSIADSKEAPPFGAEIPPWDYFGIFHPTDHHFSSQEEGKTMDHDFERTDDITRLREEEGIPDLEDEEDKATFHGREEESHDSEDEFDEPAVDTLVRSFENFNRVHEHVEAAATTTTPTLASARSETSVTEVFKVQESNSPDLSPLRSPSPEAPETYSNKATGMEDGLESKVAPKDLVLSMKDIESLFIRAYDSGKEIPKMLEANKLHFRPIFQAKESRSFSSTLVKSCFSCGEDPSQVQEEPAQNSVKYLTWHRTTSSRSSSSRNLLGTSIKDDDENLAGNLFNNFCMISGSHASTLDRLYAWEMKLYDEVKASEMVRRDYDIKCKILRQLESKGENSQLVDKSRAVVKDLHSRIRVAIHRIDSISKMIENIRDRELQPQLEELIHGLTQMWEVMLQCHKLQFLIISIAYNNGNTKISVQSDSHRQITLYLEEELSNLSSSFNKWIGAQKSYLQSINGWLLKCVSIAQKSSKTKRRQPENPLRYCGPPIYATCGVWFDKLEILPAGEVTEAIKSLETEIASFVPRQERKEGKHANYSGKTSQKDDSGIDSASNMLRDEVLPSSISSFDRFQTSLAGFCGKLNKFAEASVNMYAEVQVAIQLSKSNYDQINSKSGAV